MAPPGRKPDSGKKHIGQLVRACLVGFTGPWTRENAMSWLKLILAFLAVNWLLVQPFRIPSGSMEPTLLGGSFLGGDRVAVNKWVYGPRVPLLNYRIFRLWEPERWDIVVFRSVEENPSSNVLVKRIVGLPGERIHIADGRVYADGEWVKPPEELQDILHYTAEFRPRPEEAGRALLWYAKEDSRLVPLLSSQEQLEAFQEDARSLNARLRGIDVARLTDEEQKAFLSDVRSSTLDIFSELLTADLRERHPLKYGVLPDGEYSVVPDDCYLLLGDNSAQSRDGRVFGWVPNSHLLGRVSCIWLPFSRWRDFTGFSRTWWGKGLLYGVPAVLILMELCAAFLVRTLCVRRQHVPDALHPGDHVLIDCRAFKRLRRTRPERAFDNARGNIVAYTAPEMAEGAGANVAGKIAGLPGDRIVLTNGMLRVGGEAVRCPEDGPAWLDGLKGRVPDRRFIVIASDAHAQDAPIIENIGEKDLIGRVAAVWWPPRHARWVGPSVTVETNETDVL